MSTIPANTRLFACSRAHIYASNRPQAHRQKKKILFLSSPREKKKKRKKIKRARKSNSVADWSRVTVHIKSNYKCSLASSLVFSLSVSNSLCFSLFSFSLSFSFFPLLHRKERKCEKVRRLRLRIKIDIQKSIKSHTSITSHIPIKFDRYKAYPLHATTRQPRRQ
jgi:hypothetical protein